jgi:hypothetical protein
MLMCDASPSARRASATLHLRCATATSAWMIVRDSQGRG